jgi:hypothetical protein
MIDKSEMREKIIEFFTKYCGNKLNKNVYYRGFYSKRGFAEIYDYLQIYFEGTVLENTGIAQKYYHIYWDHMNIPEDKAFVNFQKGYRKGKAVTTAKNKKWLEKTINDFPVDFNFNLNFFTENEAKTKLHSYFKEIQYRQLSNDYNLLNWILNFLKNLKMTNYEKLVSFCHGNIFCICGKIKKIEKPLDVNNTCGDEKCISLILSNNAKSRDLSYLREREIVEKAKNNRSWYKPSENTKEKISISNKKTWTPEKIKERTERFIRDGIYEKSSNSIKARILAGEYTPKTMNRLTHKRLSSDITKIKTYRSNWELKYHEKNVNLKYEYLRIPYIYDNKQSVYIVDFWDDINRIAIEIKPESMKDSPKNLAKINALEEWCENNNATYKIITEKDFTFYDEK